MFLRKKNSLRKKINLRQSGAGFTLIELLITAAIFSIAALLATTVFSNIQTTQRQIQKQQRVSADGRYVIETIARSIRTGNINYGQFTTTNGVITNPTSTISTIDQNGQVTCYRLNNGKVDVATNAATDCFSSPTDWTPFTPDDLQVDTLNFFINPVSNPFRPVPRASSDCTSGGSYDSTKGACTCTSVTAVDACFTAQSCISTVAGISGTTCLVGDTSCICRNPNVQPHVTIYIATTAKGNAPGESAGSTLQTTVASRLYQ